jgi:hypothetical protein
MQTETKVFPIIDLSVPRLLQATQDLPQLGVTQVADDGYTYLNIDDEYIHHLCPILQKEINPDIRKPDYFGKKLGGAHITIFYADEHQRLQNADREKQHFFSIRRACLAELSGQKYFVLLVNAPSLVALRKKYGLAPSLLFKQHAIPLHITIGRL